MKREKLKTLAELSRKYRLSVMKDKISGGNTFAQKICREFKEFAVRGNVIDMAVGIIMGTAFGKIVNSLVNDVIMPPLGVIINGIDLSNHFISLTGGTYASLSAAQTAGAATINYGIFINNVIYFLIVSFTVFLMVKQVNRLRRREDVKSITPTQKSCPYCYSNISFKAIRCPACTSQLSPTHQA